MRCAVAFVTLVALSWSQLVALRCDMGTGLPDKADRAASLPLPASAAGHDHAPNGARAATHGQHHGDNEGCLMIQACGASSVRPAQAVAMTRLPAAFERAGFLASPIPVAAELAVESPPPRRAA